MPLFSYSCEKEEPIDEPSRLVGLIYEETEDFPFFGKAPETKEITIRASPLLRISKPLVYEELIIIKSADGFGFQPGIKKEIHSTQITRKLCALRFVGKTIDITIPSDAIKKPYYIILPHFSNEQPIFKPVSSR